MKHYLTIFCTIRKSHRAKHILALVIPVLFLSCDFNISNTECFRYKRGTFQYLLKAGQDSYSSIIKRNDSIQTETNETTKDVSTFAITWTNKCRYELRLLSSTENFPDSIVERRKKYPVVTEILDGTDEYYIFKTWVKDLNFVMQDTIWVK